MFAKHRCLFRKTLWCFFRITVMFFEKHNDVFSGYRRRRFFLMLNRTGRGGSILEGEGRCVGRLRLRCADKLPVDRECGRGVSAGLFAFSCKIAGGAAFPGRPVGPLHRLRFL